MAMLKANILIKIQSTERVKFSKFKLTKMDLNGETKIKAMK